MGKDGKGLASRVAEQPSKGTSRDGAEVGVGVAGRGQRLPRVLEFPPSVGLTFDFKKSAADTGGEYLEIDGTLLAHKDGPPVHTHPHQEESLHVLSGTLNVFAEGRWRQLRAGESVTVPPGAPHTLKNTHDEDTRAITVVRPALSFHDFMSTFCDLATSGKIRSLPPKDLASLLYVSMLFVRYEDTIVSVKPPAVVLKLLAFVGRRLGYGLG
jgi:quercetin dioxygenase-like cupin family protein